MPPALALPRARALTDAMCAARACLDASRFEAASAEDEGGAEDEGALEANARARAPRAARPAAAEDTAEPPWVHVFARQPSTVGGDHGCGARAAADGAPCAAAATTTRRTPCLSMPRGTCAAASGAKGRVVGAEIGLIAHASCVDRDLPWVDEISVSSKKPLMSAARRGRDDTPPRAVASSPISGLPARGDGDGGDTYVRARPFEPVRRPAPSDLRERLGTDDDETPEMTNVCLLYTSPSPRDA